jgi:hypothetical protein
MHQAYKNLYQYRPFSLGFTDKEFKEVSVEIYSDSLKYIYDFGVTENRLKDTLVKYGLKVPGITSLIKQMQEVKCIWINNLDYYVDNKKQLLVFISIRPQGVSLPSVNKKFYILTYFSQPQYYDSEGRLLDKRRVRQVRKINEDVFHRINNRVAYTVSDRFR